MGFFSFRTCDTGKSIPNVHSGKPTFTVYMKDNKGNVWREDEYEGYGEFGGKDFHELMDEMNGGTGDRSRGIELYCDPEKNKKALHPKLFEHEDSKYEDHDDPEDCEFQGFFYDE